MLEVRGLTKHFGGLTAVSDVSLDVGQGQIIGLIGPNGAGKTTVFNVVSGFLRPDSGEVRFEGSLVTGLAPHGVARLGLARTFQTPTGFPRLTVIQNLLVAAPHQSGESLWTSLLRWRAVLKEERQLSRRALDLLQQFGLDGREDVLAANLSGGESKLLEIARQVMFSPRMLLLDEPASGVNPRALGGVLGCLRRLRDRGMSLLIIDHNLGFIMSISDYVYVMAQGRVLTRGTPDEVARHEQVRSIYLGEDEDAAAA